MIFQLVSRLGSLFFLAVMLLLAISDVRHGRALWALLYGVVIGLWLGAYFVEYLLWRKRQRVKSHVVEALSDDGERLRILE